MVQMVVKHHYDDFGSHTPYPIWPRWWSHTIAIILVSMHHTHYGANGGQTPLRWLWFSYTIPNMAQMVVAHYCHHSGFHAPYPLWGKWWSNTIMMALVLIHDAQYGPDGGRTLLPSFWFPCTTPTMVQMVVKHHYDDFGSHTPYPIWPRWWSHTIAIILVSMHHTHYGSDGSQTPLR